MAGIESTLRTLKQLPDSLKKWHLNQLYMSFEEKKMKRLGSWLISTFCRFLIKLLRKILLAIKCVLLLVTIYTYLRHRELRRTPISLKLHFILSKKFGALLASSQMSHNIYVLYNQASLNLGVGQKHLLPKTHRSESARKFP